MSARRPARLLPAVLLRILPLAAVLMLGIMYVAHYHTRTVVKAEIVQKLDRETALATQEIDAKIDALVSLLRTIALNDVVINALVDETARVQGAQPLFHSMSFPAIPDATVGFLDYRGRVIASNRAEAAPETGKWQEPVLNGRTHVRIDRHDVLIAVPVFFAGLPEGSVFLRFRTSLLSFYLGLTHYSDAFALMIEGYPIRKVVAGQDVDWSPRQQSPDWIKSEGRSEKYPEVGLVLASRAEDLYSPLHGLDRFLAGIALLNFIVLTVGLVLTAILVARPLTRFGQELAGIQAADHLRRRVSPQGYKEVASVAEKFNTMLERLDKAVVSNDVLASENRQRERAEQRILDQKAEIDAVFDTVEDGIVTIDRRGRIRTANPAAFRIFGYNPDELIGRNVSMLMPEPHRSMHDLYIRKYTETGEAGIIGIGRELRAVRKDGSVFPMELFISDMMVKDQVCFVGVVRDITERHKVDQMKREFISVVSHELRTPLTSLMGSLALVNSGSFGSLSDKASKLLDMAQSNANRLIALVNDILDVEKLEAGREELRFEQVDLVELTAGAVSEMQAYGLSHDVTFELRSNVEKACVRADPHRLSQVLANLLSNAAKFSRAQTAVIVSVERHGQQIAVAVADTGPGVPEGESEKIFDKFYQADSSDSRQKQGTGLGLPIAQAIVAAHGGSIRVTSGPSGGAVFTFELAVAERVETSMPVASEPKAAAG